MAKTALRPCPSLPRSGIGRTTEQTAILAVWHRRCGISPYDAAMSDPIVAQPAPVRPDFAAAVVDVFVYLVVLNLFVEFLPQVISEGFALSLLTAVLLKVILEVVVRMKTSIKARFKEAGSTGAKVGAGFMLWALLFGSKFVVLEAVNLVFGDSVSLGGFFSVTALILTLMLARALVRRLLRPA